MNKQTLFLYPLDNPLTIVILRLTFAIIAGVLHHYFFLPLHPQHGLQSCQPTSLSVISTQALASYISSHSAGYRWASQPVHSILNLVASTAHHPSSQTISLFWGFTPALDSYAGLPSDDITSFFPCQPPSGNIKNIASTTKAARPCQPNCFKNGTISCCLQPTPLTSTHDTAAFVSSSLAQSNHNS